VRRNQAVIDEKNKEKRKRERDERDNVAMQSQMSRLSLEVQ